jgi:hypothetical protein
MGIKFVHSGGESCGILKRHKKVLQWLRVDALFAIHKLRSGFSRNKPIVVFSLYVGGQQSIV